jgi:hypothetical protein
MVLMARATLRDSRSSPTATLADSSSSAFLKWRLRTAVRQLSGEQGRCGTGRCRRSLKRDRTSSAASNGAPGNGFSCFSNAGQAAANFTPNQVTFNWSGLNIAPGTTFDTTFASWNSSGFAVPGPIAAAGLPGLILARAVAFSAGGDGGSGLLDIDSLQRTSGCGCHR